MKLFGLDISWSRKTTGEAIDLDTFLRRMDAVYETASGIVVTPENCEQSPTVKAIVTAVTNRFAVMPCHVYQKTTKAGRTRKEPVPSHPVERLLARPNDWQTRANYWQDASSWLVRYANYYAFKARGQTGPIRKLLPLHPRDVNVKQEDDWDVVYSATLQGGEYREFGRNEIHHSRLRARDGVKGDSPVSDMREAIALEIAAERMGASVFGNGAMPGMVFKYADSFAGHKDDADRKTFIDDVQQTFSRRGRFRAFFLPKGIELGDPIGVDHAKAQFLEVRQYQRTVIAGAWGVPPHLVGDLSKGTFNNVEQQDINFTTNVILPLARVFESAMERDLLTDSDRTGGIIIRFNPDAILRGDFKSRQEGLAIQRQNGIISANDWREMENMNPIPKKDGGEDYWRQGPSGQNADAPGVADAGAGNQRDRDDDASDAEDEDDDGSEA